MQSVRFADSIDDATQRLLLLFMALSPFCQLGLKA